MTVESLVEHLRTWLTEVAAEVDRTRPENQELIINEKGEPALKKLRAKAPPATLAQLEEALQEKIPESHLLDVLARIDHITGSSAISVLCSAANRKPQMPGNGNCSPSLRTALI